MTLSSLVSPDLTFSRISAADRDGVLRALADRVAAAGAVRDAEGLFLELRRREELGSTGIGGGVAIPHCKLKGLSGVTVAVATTEDGVEFAANDDAPVRLFFMVASPSEGPNLHLQALAQISRWIKDSGNVEKVLAAQSPEEISNLLNSDSETS